MWCRRFALCCLVLLYSSAVFSDWHSDTQQIMGTEIRVELWADNNALAEQAINAVMAEMRRVDRLMSPYLEGSELYVLNQTAAQQAVKVSAELFAVIDKALYYSRLSDGAFDISFASVGYLYDYRAGKQPSADNLKRLLPAINYQAIVLDPARSSVRYAHPDLKIDLGGIAKGHAVDNAIEQLKRLNIRAAIVTAGGDSRILGDRWGEPWLVGIRHPRQQQQFAAMIPLVDSAISTSGDYERFFIHGEQRVHHIINPATGKSVSDVQSVSILAPLAVDSDALSTTVFVLGVEAGLSLVNQLAGIDAMIIDADGKLHYSAELLLEKKRD